MKKVIYLLNINNYAPQVTSLCYPFIRHYAEKLHADVHIIKERKFPEWPITFEKMQIFELAQKNRADWHIYIDSDALIHPECVDYTNYLGKETVIHHGSDMCGLRWTYDKYFHRDKRNIGSCNWFTCASDWCIDLWRPFDDLTPEEAIRNIHVTADEFRNGITKEHLIDDYALSRNIAKYGLKFDTVVNMNERIGLKGVGFFHHEYTVTVPEKAEHIARVLKEWKIDINQWLPAKQMTAA